jgi:hypothetical protein
MPIEIKEMYALENIVFYSDKEIASMLCKSRSWVRTQRLLRRQGKEHLLDLDPVMIGKSPRYRKVDVDRFIAELPAG